MGSSAGRAVIIHANRDLKERRDSTLEQAALRRIATLVARGVQPDELFAVVAEEVGRVVDAPSVAVARYEADDTVTVCGTFPTRGLLFRTGARVPLEGANVLGLIRERAEPARVDDYAGLEGEIAHAVRRGGMRSSVGVPIMVAGRVWGAMVASDTERLPEDTGARLAEFTELLAAAIADIEAREALAQLADEQAALGRVATLVAEQAPTGELFGALVEEVARLLRVSTAAMGRYDHDGLVTTVAAWSDVEDALPVGRRWVPEGVNVTALVLRTGAAARIDDFSKVSGPLGERAVPVGYRSAVGCPITVDGRLWGVIATASVAEEPLPPDTEQRLERFTELVTTAISNAESRGALQRLADEHAALEHVATLVAQGAAPAEVFAAVSAEVDRVFGFDPASFDVAGVVRFEPGPALLVVGVSKSVEAVPLGSRFPPDDLFAPTHVLRTGRSARVGADELASIGGETADFLRHHGYLSQVASPIVVEGRLWGAISVNSGSVFPADTEERLESFTELVATAIANTQSRQTLAEIAGEQAALRRVATLVADGAGPADVFAAAAREVAELFGVPALSMVRLEDDGRSIEIGSWGDENPFRIGTRFDPHPGVVELIRQTGHPARIDAYSELPGAVAAEMVASGVRSSIGAPIFVDGRMWGAFAALSTAAEPLPAGAEARLASFTGLLSTAIANAQSREALTGLANEQAALRRVATLVARDAPPGEVFDAVAMEVGKLLDTDITVVGRYDGDGAATAIGSWSAAPGGVPVGTRSVLGGRNVLTLVAETERPARLDGYDDASGEAGEIARRHGWRSSIAAPIIVEGRLWGVMLVATQRPEPFPTDAEERLAAFTDLVATALANAQAHGELRRFAEEQAAHGRVATLVAAGAAPEQVFTAVVEEVSSLLGLERTELVHYEGDERGTVVASSGDHPFPAGTTWSLDDPSVMATVARTGRPARLDSYAVLTGEIAEAARGAGFQSAIGAPITVEGRLWGVMIAISTDPEPIPELSEARLGQFTELVATAVANAEARDALAQLADEQSALRRVATLVAQGVPATQLFSVVTQEIAHLFAGDNPPLVATVIRFDAGPECVLVGASREYEGEPVGSRWTPKELYVSTRVLRTGGSARVDEQDLDSLGGADAAVLRLRRFLYQVGSPVVVQGRLWGAMTLNSEEPLAPDVDEGLRSFTELVATAIANADSRAEVDRLAGEQAALRRVATLVAQGVQPDAIFSAVGEEVGRLFGSSITTVGRFDPDSRTLVAVGVGPGGEGLPLGSRWELDDLPASARVVSTGRSVRFDEVDGAAVRGPLAAIVSHLGIASTVASPIFVEGHLWGVVSVAYDKQLPPEAEERLEKFSELIATAIGNAESSAELAASRRRIVAAGDEARRRIERDLHDGIQQRLIALTFRARALTRRPPHELPAIAAELSDGLKDVTDELREISRGIHPTILTEAGLGPALRALARRSDIPVDADVSLDERLPTPVETAAYYIASEALTNVAKHAHANVVHLLAAHDDGALTLEVRDDGIGGVDATRGSGILGLTDRAEALGGTISIASPPRGGTTLTVRLPSTT
jgi:GAF domain-containing protein